MGGVGHPDFKTVTGHDPFCGVGQGSSINIPKPETRAWELDVRIGLIETTDSLLCALDNLVLGSREVRKCRSTSLQSCSLRQPLAPQRTLQLTHNLYKQPMKDTSEPIQSQGSGCFVWFSIRGGYGFGRRPIEEAC